MAMATSLRRAVFMDRDGTLIHDVGYPKDPGAVHLLPGAATALADLKEQGFLLIVISNQSGIGRGLVTPEQARQVHAEVESQLADFKVRLDGAYYCPHAPEDGCVCRKPSPGLLLRAARDLPIDLSRSFMVGDKISDLEAGRAAGCHTVYFTAEPDAKVSLADFVASNWAEAAKFIRGSFVKNAPAP
jgi:D-glycero-D-manno-heptose 1,7-bisphosphate phosphatase